jgi:hypothetical protein
VREEGTRRVATISSRRREPASLFVASFCFAVPYGPKTAMVVNSIATSLSLGECHISNSRGPEYVVAHQRVLGIDYAHTATYRIGRVAVHLVVLDERLARVGNVANVLKADTGPSVVDHEVVVRPETVWMVGRVPAENVAPQAVTLVVVDVGVFYFDLRDGLQARTRKAQEVRILGGLVLLYSVECATGVGDPGRITARNVYRKEARVVGRAAQGSPWARAGYR